MTRLTIRQAKQLGLIPGPRGAPVKPQKTAAKWDVQLIPGAEEVAKLFNVPAHLLTLGVKFIIPENMPSLNEWKNWHWAKQAEYKQYLTNALAILATKVGRPQYEKARVEVVHYFRVKRMRDEDNQAPKFLLDALRGAKVIQDDNTEALELERPRFEIDRTAWRTEVYVWEVKSD